MVRPSGFCCLLANLAVVLSPLNPIEQGCPDTSDTSALIIFPIILGTCSSRPSST